MSFLKNFFKSKILVTPNILATCGHKTLKKDSVTAFGEKTTTEILISNGKTDYCHRCLEKMAIQCAWCGEVIFIGDPITLYSPDKQSFEIPKHAVTHGENPLQLVGCLRWGCADTGADRAGFWYPPGKVKPVESLLSMAAQSGNIITVDNLADPTEIPREFEREEIK